MSAFNSCTKCVGSPGIIHNRIPGHGCDHRSLTSQLNIALIRILFGSLTCLAYFFDMLSMGVCATRHWQMSGRLVQELNVCTVQFTHFLLQWCKRPDYFGDTFFGICIFSKLRKSIRGRQIFFYLRTVTELYLWL